MTDQDLDRLEALLAKATDRGRHPNDRGYWRSQVEGELFDAAPALIDRARRLREIEDHARRYIPAVMTLEEKAAAFDVLLAKALPESDAELVRRP